MSAAGDRPGRRRDLLALACLTLLCGAAPAAADPKESYRKGIEAVDRGQWAEVVRYMREAAAQQGTEGEPVKIYGVRIVPYLPHFYLGLALSQAGTCDEALAQWQESESQGAVQKTVHYKALVQGRDLCKQKLAHARPSGAAGGPAPGTAPGPDAAVLVPAVREAESALQKATEADAQVARRRGDPEYAEPWKDESAEGVEASAANAIAATRGRIDRAKNLGQVAELQEAARAVTRVRQDLEALAGRLDKRRTELRQAREQRDAADKLAAERAATESQAREKAAADKLAAEKESADRQAREREEVARKEAESRDQAQRQALAQEISRLTAEARKLLDQAAAPAQPRSGNLDRSQARLQALVRRASPPPRAAAAAELQRLRDDLSASTATLEKALAAVSKQPGPPPELRAAARALFRASYEEVVHSLAGATFAERRATVTAALLLAAARYSLYLQGGEKDPALRQQAGADALTCRRLAPTLNPDPRLFSPRFVQFFRSAS
jgi:hypothetical protein